MSAQCADIFYHLFTICFTKQFPHFQQPSIMRLDINLERMVIHRNILLYRHSGAIYQMMRLLVRGPTNVVIQVYGDNISDEIFRLRNNECCYTDVYGAIYQMQDYWSVEQRTLL